MMDGPEVSHHGGGLVMKCQLLWANQTLHLHQKEKKNIKHKTTLNTLSVANKNSRLLFILKNSETLCVIKTPLCLLL